MFLGLKKCCVWMLSAMLVQTVRPLPSQQAQPVQSRTEPSVVLSLQDYGWEPPERGEVDKPSIAVDHQGRVIVGFTARERNGLVTRDQPSLEFHILRFLPDGKVDLSLSLPTNTGGKTGIYVSDTDRIIARANNRLQVLQTGEGNPQEPVWKTLATCTLRCLVEQSYSRHTLLLYTEDADPPLTLIRLLQQPVLERCGKMPQLTESSEDRIQNYPQSITDEFAYWIGGGEAYRWPLCDYGRRVELPLHAHGRWTIVNDKVFVANTYDIHKNRWELEVVSLDDGKVNFRPTTAKHESAGVWVPIRSGARGGELPWMC